MKNSYNKTLEDYKNEFGKGQTPTSKLKCFASYLWEKNEKEILKKFILSEAYEEVMGEKSDITELPQDSSLMKAM